MSNVIAWMAAEAERPARSGDSGVGGDDQQKGEEQDNGEKSGEEEDEEQRERQEGVESCEGGKEHRKDRGIARQQDGRGCDWRGRKGEPAPVNYVF